MPAAAVSIDRQLGQRAQPSAVQPTPGFRLLPRRIMQAAAHPVVRAAADAERGRALLRRETRPGRYDDGAVAAARARSPSPTVTYDLDADALPSAAPTPKKVRMSAGTAVTIRDGTGSLAHLVKRFNASTIEMQFEQKDGSISPNVWAFPHAEVKKAVRKTEGTDAKCMVCACVKTDANRHKYCNMASNTGHESRNAAMHTFVGQPWELIRGRML